MSKRVGSARQRAASVEQAAGDFLGSIKKLARKTQEEYSQRLGVFVAWCTEQRIMLGDVNRDVVDAFVEHLKATHSPARNDRAELSSYTLANYVRVIKIFLNWCLEDDEHSSQINVQAIVRIHKPQVTEVIIETFTPEQLEALFKACDKEESEHLRVRDRAIIAMLLDTAIRASELVTLKLGNLKLDSRDPHIRVLGKGSVWGEVGMGEIARRYVGKYVRQFREPAFEEKITVQSRGLSPRQVKQVKQQLLNQELVFVNRNGQPLTVSGLYRLVDRLGEWAGIEGVRCSPHTFRHTFAKMFMQPDENGKRGDIYQLSKLLRHGRGQGDVKTTENYLKSLRQTDARRGAKSVLDNL